MKGEYASEASQKDSTEVSQQDPNPNRTKKKKKLQRHNQKTLLRRKKLQKDPTEASPTPQKKKNNNLQWRLRNILKRRHRKTLKTFPIIAPQQPQHRVAVSLK